MTKQRFNTIISKFSKVNVAVVGDIMLDAYWYGKVERVNQEHPGCSLLRVTHANYRLGGAGNVATNVASLGGITKLYGRTGLDLYNDCIYKICCDNNIATWFVADGKTIVKQRAIEITHNDYLWRADLNENELICISTAMEESILNSLQNQNPQVIILSDYNKGMFWGGLAPKIIKWANRNKIIAVIDPKPSNIGNFNNATVIKINYSEMKNILGITVLPFCDAMLNQFHTLVKCKHVVVTRSQDGMSLTNDKKEVINLSAHAQSVIDVTGAGDTVAAVLALGFVTGATITESAELANMAAGIVVGKIGTASVTLQELRSAFNAKVS